MSISLIGKDGTNIASVSNAVPVFTGDATTPANVGGLRIFSENDTGEITGTALLLSPETSQDYRLRVGTDTILFTETFNATAQNTSNWSYTFNTLTAAQPGAGSINFSVVQGTTNAHGAFMRSFQYFPIVGTAPLAVEFSAGVFVTNLVANEVWLMGLGLPTAATTPPTDGAWLKLTSAGYTGVISNSGVLTETGVIWATGDIVLSDYQKWAIIVAENTIQYWRNDVLLAELSVPASNGQVFQGGSLPVFMHKYNTGSVSNTNTMRVSDITVSLMDIQTNKPWQDQLAGAGQGSYLGQNGHTQGKTSLWTNNTAPAAVALTNTAGAFTSLGGIAAVLPTLTTNNDGIIFSYQNPAPTINITGRNLLIRSIRVQGVVSVVLAGGPVLYAYAVAFGHTAASLATGETATFANNTTHAPRIVPIGIETYTATAAVGVLGSGGLTLDLPVPIVVRPGEFVQIIARNMGTVTTTGAITVVASFNGYWE